MMVRRHARSEPVFRVAKWLRERRSGRIQLISCCAATTNLTDDTIGCL